MLRISDTTLKRLINYDRVMAQRLADADSRQWRIMTLEIMRECETLRQQALEVSLTLAYASHLNRVQNGLVEPGAGSIEPLLHNHLVELLQSLDIPLEEA
ncbi:hypothetical protein DESUT3_27710 [Desulfuromonas versatilis]|uniref:Uncharacterized protein n=1 Tax=Desulfuromonas versatilis TaxID=2802975 RepID=A0ABM8HUM2_9BACT|nr:hypothetical protein [Desulfuromonas versatilis]BCR05702.1 hypothetical protein DESUT3_27710 [Desulfuromonas versatilis]